MMCTGGTSFGFVSVPGDPHNRKSLPTPMSFSFLLLFSIGMKWMDGDEVLSDKIWFYDCVRELRGELSVNDNTRALTSLLCETINCQPNLIKIIVLC